MPKHSSAASVRSGSTVRLREDDRSTIRDASPHLSDEDNQDPDYELTEGDYASQRDMILGDENDDEEEDEDSDEFVYTGADAETPTAENYATRLAEALGDDVVNSDDELDEREIETELVGRRIVSGSTLDSLSNASSDRSHSPRTPPRSTTSSRLDRPSLPTSTSMLTPSRPFIHPSISRLRSHTPQRMSSSASVTTLNTNIPNAMSPSPSHFSAISRVSSLSNLHESQSETSERRTLTPREAFCWTHLKILSDYVFPKTSQKAINLLGSSWGIPRVMVSNGLICIGTDLGLAVVFDFKQQFKFVCGSEASAKSLGAVTALALSNDHTFLAVGHATGHINLYDLNKPQAPARSVPPTTAAAVASGRKEGHLAGSAVTQLGFVSTRHTAIVSSDDSGLAFYHSLGKILFVEANDVLRILGKYPEVVPPSVKGKGREVDDPSSPGAKPRRAPTAILSMAPLPLGTSQHPAETYDLVALLTPLKLVVVGLKPAPRTWFRRHRAAGLSDEAMEKESEAARWRGCVAWFPSVTTTPPTPTADSKKKSLPDPASLSAPMLVYSWGRTLRLLRVREELIKTSVEDTKVGGGKRKTIEVGQVAFDEVSEWKRDEDVLALQWLNVNQLLILTVGHLEVYELKSSTVVERISIDTTAFTSLYGPPLDASSLRLAHSMRVYKGKVFILGAHEVRVGTLLSWADRILGFVEDGDFLSAIDLARAYYVGSAPGNRNGLPEDPAELKEVVGKKLHDLMVASAAYAFSEDRMMDSTHYSPDGRGVDLTSLFEGLVTSCVRASISLDDYDFLYEDLYERYNSTGISSIFLRQLEPFILDSSLRVVPTYVTQQLIELHGEKSEYEAAERLIWHIDPLHLDSNQAIKLCQRYELYDALIYVFTRTLQDFVSPVVELLGLIRKLRQRTGSISAAFQYREGDSKADDPAVERMVPNAYKLYPYLSNSLSGLSYPSEEPLPPQEGARAKKEVYRFLFSGHSLFWPEGPGGRLVVTADEDGGKEPTYPYLRLLLRFDSEALLHALDVAFEDPYLNDSPQGVSRQAIVNILLKLISPDDHALTDLMDEDITFLRIFISRNIPKYPQFITVAPSAQQDLLIGLATDEDQSTTEDRQLAAEFLLSAYTPHDRDELIWRFESAGFFRILRSWYREDRDWPNLIATYTQDKDVRQEELFSSLDGILRSAQRMAKGTLPAEVQDAVSESLALLLENDVTSTAVLLEKYSPDMHAAALRTIGEEETYRQFVYLRSLIEPHALGDDHDRSIPLPPRTVSAKLDPESRTRYLQLMFQYHPSDIIRLITNTPTDYFDSQATLLEAEEAGAYDVVVWAMDRQGRTGEAFTKVDVSGKAIAARLARFVLSAEAPDMDVCQKLVDQQRAVVRMGVQLCRAHEQNKDGSSEDSWFGLLQSQIAMVQSVASAVSDSPLRDADELDPFKSGVLGALRELLRETFEQFVSQSSSADLSFPRLFKRLVDSTSSSRASNKGFYTEFRLILTGMLESYRFEGDFLTLNNRLVEQDLFETIAEGLRMRTRGWRPKTAVCAGCKEGIREPKEPKGKAPLGADVVEVEADQVQLFRSGLLYHSRCVPVA